MDTSVSAKSSVLADSLAQSQNSQIIKGKGIERSQKRTLLMWLVLGLILPLLSMIPFLYLQGKRLIDQQSFLFFPLTTAVGVWLLATTCDYRPASRRRARLAVVLACTGMGLTVLGIFFISPWIVQVAMVVVIFAWALGAFGGSEWTRVVAICSLFAVSVPLPIGLDGLINLRLQSVSSWACSGFLDAISVPNIVEGDVLQIQEKKLSVSEVCGGPDSIFALVALGLVVVVVRRCSFLVGLSTLLSIPFCFIFGNSIRLLIVALGFQYFGADLSTGFGHIGTSVIVFAGSVACVILFHISIKAILDPISRKMGENNLTFLYQRLTSWPQMIKSSSSIGIQSTEDYQDSSRWRRVSQLSLGLCCFACLVFGALSAYAIFSVGKYDALTGVREELAATFPPQDVFPDKLGNLRKTSFSPTKQSETNVRGKYSHLWKFDDRGSQVVVSLDFPFEGWRP
ncbi:MAG TPA: archaeosortase/exosortase family protein, partial [Pirellula sp.]|nr:archaeosortase/exosortase family protein [Pirellula sp.]